MIATMLTEMAQDLFNLLMAGAIAWGFGWMVYQCCQSKPKPQSFRKRRQR